MKKIITYFIFSLLLINGLHAQKFFLETKTPKGQITMPDDRIPSKYKLFKVNKEQLKNYLSQAPDLRSGNISSLILEMPLPNGKTEKYHIYKTHPMSPGLEVKFPDILSFRGINKKGQRLRLDINGSGVFYSIYGLKEGRAVFQIFDNQQTYVLYYLKNQKKPTDNVCLTPETIDETSVQRFLSRQTTAFGDGLHRTYRLAYATTGEFSQYHIQRAEIAGTLPSNATDAQKKQAVLDALVVIVNRVNEVYEVDLAITFQLVPNNTAIIYLDGATDPYTNNDGNALITENQTNVDNVIGSANYDIGHVANTAAGGLAGFGVVCVDGFKAQGQTGMDHPIGDEYAIDFVAHEMGHQFGANHTFSNYCGARRSHLTAVEPGSGSTIMAYADVCPPNIQSDSDPQFHYFSINQMWDHVQENACAQTANANNNTPQVDAGSDKWIPKNTPFKLEAIGTDADAGSTLAYTWDEMDVFVDPDPNGTDAPPQPTNTTGPMFRVLPYHTENFRYFPKLEDVLNGSYGNTWEVLPNVQRVLSFQVVVRDLVTPGGQIANDDIVLNVDGNSGPFRITSHQTDETWTPGNTETITWDVAGTNTGNINCQQVDILLSLDGGNTYPIVLASNVANDGSQDIIVPNNVSTNARYMVKASDNYFFDVNRGNITLGSFTIDCNNNYNASPSVAIPDNDTNGVTSTISVPDNKTIDDVNVSLNISHTFIADLTIKLTSPQGTEVVLFDHNCLNASQENPNINVTFDDEGTTMNCGSMNAGGTYQPVNQLSDFDEENAQGTWTLTVSDNASGDTGTLNSWGLNLCLLTPLNADENIINGLKIYPNPASQNIHITFTPQSTQQEITVTDMLGREMYSVKLNKTTEFTHKINVHQWTKGLYLFNITDGNKQRVEKIIIE